MFCKSCFVCCETSSLVKFSLIICRKVETNVISCRTFVCLDVSVWTKIYPGSGKRRVQVKDE